MKTEFADNVQAGFKEGFVRLTFLQEGSNELLAVASVVMSLETWTHVQCCVDRILARKPAQDPEGK